MSWLRQVFGSTTPPNQWHPPLAANRESFHPSVRPTVFRGYATVRGTDRITREIIFRSGCGASSISQAEADRLAKESAERNLTIVPSGAEKRDTYAYSLNRQREPVIETLAVVGGAVAAEITLNGYGALVVNANSVLFADVDTRSDEQTHHNQSADDTAAVKLRSVLDSRDDLAFRVYRTRNGWRYLCTSRAFNPASEETCELLEKLGADVKYVLLCRVQKCFRARLTPKPWRIGESSYKSDSVQGVAKKRIEHYLRKAGPFATAAFTTEVGQTGSAPSPEVELIVAHHDAWCAANSGRPLA